jgi:hypothetical protein
VARSIAAAGASGSGSRWWWSGWRDGVSVTRPLTRRA